MCGTGGGGGGGGTGSGKESSERGGHHAGSEGPGKGGKGGGGTGGGKGGKGPGAPGDKSSDDGFFGGIFGTSPAVQAMQANNIPAAVTFGLANMAVPGVGALGALGNALGADRGKVGNGTGPANGGEGGLLGPAPVAPPLTTAPAPTPPPAAVPGRSPTYTPAVPLSWNGNRLRIPGLG